MPRGQTQLKLHRPGAVDAHVLAGQDVDRRAARSPSRSCTCTRSSTRRLPYSTIDMDFMNLNQAAHGDREFGFITARLRLARKVVVGFLAGCRNRAGDRRVDPRRAWLARVAAPEGSPLWRQHARRRRHRRRQGRGAEAVRLQRQRATASATSTDAWRSSPTPRWASS